MLPLAGGTEKKIKGQKKKKTTLARRPCLNGQKLLGLKRRWRTIPDGRNDAGGKGAKKKKFITIRTKKRSLRYNRTGAKASFQ